MCLWRGEKNGRPHFSAPATCMMRPSRSAMLDVSTRPSASTSRVHLINHSARLCDMQPMTPCLRCNHQLAAYPRDSIAMSSFVPRQWNPTRCAQHEENHQSCGNLSRSTVRGRCDQKNQQQRCLERKWCPSLVLQS